MPTLPNPWLILAELVIVIGIGGGCYAYGHHNGELAVQTQFDEYKLKQTREADKQAEDNRNALAAQQAEFDSRMEHTNLQHAAATSEITKRRDALATANSSLTQQLRKYIAASTRQQPAVVQQAGAGGPVDHATDPADVRDGVSDLSQYLLNRFSDADQCAVDLTAAQQVIVTDRMLCNGELPGVTQTEKQSE